MSRKNRAMKPQRRELAQQSQHHLMNLLRVSTNEQQHQVIVRHLLSTSRRHRLKIPRDAYHHFCKHCQVSHFHSTRYSVRIRMGQVIRTCTYCGSRFRLGGGPKHHRRG